MPTMPYAHLAAQSRSDGEFPREVSAASPTAPAKSAVEGWIPISVDKKRFLKKEEKESLANSR